ncbi:hypothetical protein AVEN_136401-1, partial [Araneus ventricosus]
MGSENFSNAESEEARRFALFALATPSGEKKTAVIYSLPSLDAVVKRAIP